MYGNSCLVYVRKVKFLMSRMSGELEKLFGVTKLSSSITSADNEGVRADVKSWRSELDSKIFFN